MSATLPGEPTTGARRGVMSGKTMARRFEADDPLDVLRVIDRLEVGEPRLARDRVSVAYTVHRDGRADSFDFSYRFQEPVLDPADPGAANLAAVMGAQVALNYGLFCDEIVFHGALDALDRELLVAMAENTAREIYVKKFLEPNPFLIGPARELPVLLRETYSQARLVFTNDAGDRIDDGEWRSDSGRVAVLSSGGKESLLSHALLCEAGVPEVHPIFINESGKHWFTALNAYRHFAATCPLTARVWTNSDRLFSWMLRRLPFIRPDFDRVRADEYPIRLWTVAVFVFGAVPLLRSRGIGRLVIGDEFDTTVSASHQGIDHHDGLYDQSRLFDHELTRYFARKGWGVEQFSILRPLSELLVERILLERYPDAQRHQVSCHAAHIEDGRVRPCGRCEKCSRVVGMLLALGGDPAACGYTAAQVERCLAALGARSLTQESAAQEHLAWLLRARGLLPGGRIGAIEPRERPEIVRLRFDPERSPASDIPADLRAPLLRIYLEHAAGALRRENDSWIEIDPASAVGA